MKRIMAVILLVQIAHADQPRPIFGHNLSSYVGVAACPLTATSEGVRRMAAQGFGVITYKTIRTVRTPIKSPDIHGVGLQHQLTRSDIGSRCMVTDRAPTEQDCALTNLYGIGSLDPQETIADIVRARAALDGGQLLIVSIYGSGDTQQEQIDDFLKAALIAAAGGAQVIEANLSCPNLATQKALYKNPECVYAVCSAIKSAILDIPLSIKVSVFDDYEHMHEVIMAAYHAGARGICGINTVPMQVVTHEGNPVYGVGRETSGVSGAPIRELALEFTRDAHAIIQRERFDMVLFAAGGVMNAQDVAAFRSAGADIVLSATAVMVGIDIRRS